jgi:Arm DNA-binding domain
MAATNTLSDAAIRKASPGDKPRKLADGGGLYLEVQPSGARYWRLKFSPSWTAFQTDRGRCFSVIVDDGGGARVIF